MNPSDDQSPATNQNRTGLRINGKQEIITLKILNTRMMNGKKTKRFNISSLRPESKTFMNAINIPLSNIVTCNLPFQL